MNTDNFTEAARAEAERRYIENDPDYPDRGTAIARAAAFAVGAEWGRNHALAQEPSDAEVEAAAKAIYLFEADYRTEESWERETATYRVHFLTYARAALSAARAVRIAR